MTVAAPPPQANMGEPEPRLDARLKVTGEAHFASDMPVSNPAYAFLVTSAIARGRISALDLTEAGAVPGVLDILTHENTGELKDEDYGAGGGGCSTSMQRLGPEIGHEGQIVAMVVAETFEAAREAAYKVRINYLTAAASASFGSPGVTREDATKVSPRHTEVPRIGDLAAALAAADVVI